MGWRWKLSMDPAGAVCKHRSDYPKKCLAGSSVMASDCHSWPRIAALPQVCFRTTAQLQVCSRLQPNWYRQQLQKRATRQITHGWFVIWSASLVLSCKVAVQPRKVRQAQPRRVPEGRG